MADNETLSEYQKALNDILGTENNLENSEVKKDDYVYIGVVFGNKKILTEKGEPTFDVSATHYTYKTKERYTKGQLITVPTKFGTSKVMVVDECIDPKTIKYDLKNILEI